MSCLSILIQVLRHAAVSVAVLAVLMNNFGFHLHAHPAESGNCASSAAHGLISCTANADSDAPSAPDFDLDHGDACDCPAPTVSMPQDPSVILFTAAAHLVHSPELSVAPEYVSYPPDPPPARLS